MAKDVINYEYIDYLERTKWKRYWKTILKDWRLYVLIIPAAIFFIMFNYKPMLGILIAFKDYKSYLGIYDSSFKGLHSFEQLFFGVRSFEFWQAFRNTFVVSLYGLFFGFPVPIILALLFAEIKNTFYRVTTQILTYLPHFLSTVVITSIIIIMAKPETVYSEAGVLSQFLYVLSDVIKNIISFISFNSLTVDLVPRGTVILETADYFRPLYIIEGIWQSAGYSSIVFFAAIMGVSVSNYEAARIDGANKLAQIRHVTLPGIGTTLAIMLILRIGSLLSIGYERILLLYPKNINEVYRTADVISTFVFREALGLTPNPSLATAADLFNGLIAMCLVLGANFISRRVSQTQTALF